MNLTFLGKIPWWKNHRRIVTVVQSILLWNDRSHTMFAAWDLLVTMATAWMFWGSGFENHWSQCQWFIRSMNFRPSALKCITKEITWPRYFGLWFYSMVIFFHKTRWRRVRRALHNFMSIQLSNGVGATVFKWKRSYKSWWRTTVVLYCVLE